jgi:hypothetical protein
VTLEKRPVERLPQGADGVHEDVVEHGPEG